MEDTLIDRISIANSQILKCSSFDEIIEKSIELGLDLSKSDLGCIYIYTENQDLPLIYKKGKEPFTKKLNRKMEIVKFLEDCKEIVVIHNKEKNPFSEIFLDESMKSAIAIPIINKHKNAIYILNSLNEKFYNKELFDFFNLFHISINNSLNNLNTPENKSD